MKSDVMRQSARSIGVPGAFAKSPRSMCAAFTPLCSIPNVTALTAAGSELSIRICANTTNVAIEQLYAYRLVSVGLTIITANWFQFPDV